MSALCNISKIGKNFSSRFPNTKKEFKKKKEKKNQQQQKKKAKAQWSFLIDFKVFGHQVKHFLVFDKDSHNY